MINLQDKIAIVTGASSGLGQAVVVSLAKEKLKVFALARGIEQCELPPGVIKIKCNLRDLPSIDKAFGRIDEEAKRIDYLVNCAGCALVGPFEKNTREEIENLFEVNLLGNIYIAQEVYKRMVPQKSGQIINVGSTSSLRGREMEALYCASKWGLRGFTESLRLEARNHDIKVAGLYPGGMQSNFWKNYPDKYVGRYMKPEDIAEQIVNLLKAGSGVTIAEIVIERP